MKVVSFQSSRSGQFSTVIDMYGSAEVAAYSWAAQVHLNAIYRRLAAKKGAHTAVVATARELSGFVWGLMTDNLGPAR